MKPEPEESARTRKPRVIYATIYPPEPEGRAETCVTRELLREYLAAEREFELSVVIASAHRASLDVAAGVLAEFPAIPAELMYLETRHAGARAEEISHCKEQLPRRLMTAEWDYLLFMDADVWTPIARVPEWIGIIGSGPDFRFVKVKYCLRSKLASPHHALGAYFHHKALLARMKYWREVFPREANGLRKGAPDCFLHDYLEGNGCKKIVPDRLTTYHFINAQDAHVYRDGDLSLLVGARNRMVSGEAMREALAPKPVSATNDMPVVPDGMPTLVSAIMITGKSVEREWLARVAVQAFVAQTHPRKELVIVNHGGKPLGMGRPDVHEIMVPVGCRVTLGDLRNLGLSAAAGEWVIQWDDDDWHAPERIAEQLRYAERNAAVLLRSQLRYSFHTRSAWVVSLGAGIDGTILHHKQVPFKYPGMAKGEDTEFLKHFAKRVVVPNDAGLYVRFFHGANTWSERHIMHEFAGRQDVVRLNDAQRARLFDVVLPQYAGGTAFR